MLPKEAQYLKSIHHDGSPRYVCLNHPGELRYGDEVTIRVRTGFDAPVERLLLRTCPDGEQQFVEMQPAQETDVCRWWQAQIQLKMPITGYRFLLFTPDGAWWYNGTGLHQGLPTDAEDFRILAGYIAPTWVRDSVFYQIFPDRFADGDPANNVRTGEFNYRGTPAQARSWGQPPTPGGPEAMVEFYGGDLAGIQAHLDDLQELGVNALYLNPIFTAYSNHRYDVTDYDHVDPHLGGNAALAELRRATRQREMRLLLDIVPNHCGVMHPWFQAAVDDPSAPSAEFFTFYNHPVEYATWLGVSTLPKFNYRSRRLREVMYEGEDAVLRRWLRPPYAVDGWRLDVANMLGRQGSDQIGVEVGQGIRAAVKSENPQAYLLGENFFDASAQLQGNLWDASMNYMGFANPLWYWLDRFSVRQHSQPRHVASTARWPTEALVRSWNAYRAAIPWVIARQQFNLLGSHDTARILSVVGGNAALNRLAAGILFTYVGVPCVYYGDEVGLAGEGSDVRACMPWDMAVWDSELRSFYRTLIQLRRTSPALIHGGFQVLVIEADTLAYLRDAEDEQLVVVGHRGPAARPSGVLPVWHGAIPDGTEMVEVFSRERRTVSGGYLHLPALETGIQIWQARSS